MAAPSTPPVLLCVAHTADAPGAVSPGGLTEHAFSGRACAVAAEHLEDLGYRAEIVVGTKTAKIKRANARKWACLVEPHFNASDSALTRGYMSIHAAGSIEGKRLARACCRAFEAGFPALGVLTARWLGPWPVPSPMVRHPDLPLLTATKPPACITEYAFATSLHDALLIDRPRGAEECGAMLARGILDYLTGGGT